MKYIFTKAIGLKDSPEHYFAFSDDFTDSEMISHCEEVFNIIDPEDGLIADYSLVFKHVDESYSSEWEEVNK